jgi:hypothetical protein
MEVRLVDPRDIEREMRAVYRVHFWNAARTVCEEFELADVADVREVLDWIERNAVGREVEAMIVVPKCDLGRRDALGSCGAYLIGPLDHTGASSSD